MDTSEPADRPADPTPGTGTDDTARPERADQTDRLVLEVARSEFGPLGTGDLVVLDDATGALIDAALAATAGGGHRVLVQEASSQRAHALADEHPEERAAQRLVIAGVDGAPAELTDLLAGASPQLALGRLPKALAALEARAAGLARAGVPALVAGARVKHMTRTQNDVLARAFAEVHASRGLGKSRALVARDPRPGAAAAAVHESAATLDIRGQREDVPLRGIGGVFGGATPDAGSLLLLEALDEALSAGEAIVIPPSGETSAPEGETADAPAGSAAPSDAAAPEVAAPEAEAEATVAPAPATARDADAPLDAVDLGSGNGLLTAYLLRMLPEARVLASDDDLDAVLSTGATLAADPDADADRVRVTWEASLAGQPSKSADLVLLNPPFHDGTALDATLVHGLLDAAARVLRPGGSLWFVHNSHLRYRTEVERRVGPVTQRARDRRFTVLQATRR